MKKQKGHEWHSIQMQTLFPTTYNVMDTVCFFLNQNTGMGSNPMNKFKIEIFTMLPIKCTAKTWRDHLDQMFSLQMVLKAQENGMGRGGGLSLQLQFSYVLSSSMQATLTIKHTHIFSLLNC